MSWQDDLGYIREVAPDEPKLRAAVQRLWNRLEKCERAKQAEAGWPEPAPMPADYWETAE